MFSVVIPLFNKELSIQNTIESVLQQTYQEFEIIIIDDGSTDNSANQVKEISDSRIKLIQQKNQGVSAARNRGIKESQFEWIALLDGDDLWEPNHLQEISTMMLMFPDYKVYATSFKYSRSTNNYLGAKAIYKVDNYFRRAKSAYILWTSIVVVHKKAFNSTGGFNEILNNGEDLDLWAKLARKYEIIKSDKITSTYNIDAENRAQLSKDIVRTHAYHIDLDNCLSPDEEDYYKVVIMNRLFHYFRQSNYSAFFKLMHKHKKVTYNQFTSFAYNRVRNNISRSINSIFNRRKDEKS